MSSDSHEGALENAKEQYKAVSQSEAEDRLSRRNMHNKMRRQNKNDKVRDFAK